MSPTSRTFRLNGIRFILCICIVLVSVDWITASDGCEFPSEIQTLVPHHSPRSWHGQVRDQYTSFAFQMDVTGGVIRQTPTDSRAGPAPVTRHCFRPIGDDRYLVSIEDADGNRRGYSCMRFLMRSADVVQVSASDVSRGADDGLCGDDALRSDKWLIVDKTRFGTHRIRCPIEGGFTLSVFDKLRQRGVCDAWNGEIRLESECSHNDGLVFLFRTQSCVPEGMMMYATQPTHCLAAWTEGAYTFTIVRHDFYLYAWLLRFPTDAPDSFSTYLFKDFFADTTHHVTENLNYLRMDTTRDRPRQPGDLCYDDYERCTHMTAPCSGGINPPNAALTCPLKCGMCARSSPVRCRLSPDWIGKWDSDGRSHNRSNSITINGTTMIVHSHHVAQHMHCVRWQEGSDSESVMLVTEYANGCRPRYTCARVGTVSPSQLNVTFGKTVTWPFVENRSEPLDCAATGFKPRRNELEANISRSLLLHWRTTQHPVSCHLPFKTSGVEVFFRNGTTCSGGRLAETRGRRAIEFNLRGCSRTGIVGSYEFSCLESTRFQPDDDLLIIARTNSSADVFCLVFPFADDATFHLIQGSDLCQSAVLRTADLDSLHLLRGTLSGIVPRSTAVPSTEAPSSSAAPTSDAGTSARVTTGRAADLPIPDVTRSSSSDFTPPWVGEGNASVPPLTPRPTEHPVVVGFVAFLFAIVQTIIYFCNCF